MKGDAKVIEFLNAALTNELTSINQYFLHSRMCKNWGYKELAEHAYTEAIDEMKHADMFIERILFLEGLPNLQRLGKLRIGETAVECLKCDLALEMEAAPKFREAIAHCEQVSDFTSREIFAKVLAQEEEHIDWLEIQLGLVKELGEAMYLQTKVDS